MDEGYEAGFTFQLTTSRGGRPNPLPMQALICYFNSRPHEEVDKTLQTEGALAYLFQLTTSRGGRQIGGLLYAKRKDFNSRPHEEVDSNFYAKSFPF